MRILRLLHRWTGLLIGLFFFISCLSGCLIVIGRLSGSYSPFWGWMRSIHTSLFIGSCGHTLIGIASLLCLFEIISGYWLWGDEANRLGWNAVKHGKSFWSGIKRSLNWKFPTIVYGTHVAGGFWSGLILLLMAVTGLTWSFGWFSRMMYFLFESPDTSGWGGNLFHTLSALHIGSWGGVWSRILWLLASLLGASLPVTGLLIFMKKRTKKN